MATNTDRHGIEADLAGAIEELHAALGQATQSLGQATRSIERVRQILPRVGALTNVFDELESLIQNGRRQAGIAESAATYGRPTLVVPGAARATTDGQTAPAPVDDAWAQIADAWGETPAAGTGTAIAETSRDMPATPQLICFQLEFESTPGPLDLRTVDDAVSEHPAVRDVALLDYDGRRATLKVWIEPSATPSDVRTSLVERSRQLFGETNEVSIIALEAA